MTLFEWQMFLALILTLAIGVCVYLLYRRHNFARPLMWAIMACVGHGVLFAVVVLYRHMVLDLHHPTPIITSWSATWRLHALGTVFGVLYAILERGDD